MAPLEPKVAAAMLGRPHPFGEIALADPGLGAGGSAGWAIPIPLAAADWEVHRHRHWSADLAPAVEAVSPAQTLTISTRSSRPLRSRALRV